MSHSPETHRWYLKLVIDARWAAHPLDPHPATTAFGAQPPVGTVATNDKVWPHTGHPLGRSGYASSLPMPKMTKMLTVFGVQNNGHALPRLGSVAED